MSSVCNLELPLLQRENLINTAAGYQREKISHCRFCAKEKKFVELLDLTDDKQTLDLYVMILKFFQIDFVNFSIEEIPKTTCKSCYNKILTSYNFFLNIKESQIVLNYIYGVKKENVDENLLNTEQSSIEKYEDEIEDSDPLLTNTVEMIIEKHEDSLNDVSNILNQSMTRVDHSNAEYDSNNLNTESEDSDEETAFNEAFGNSDNNNMLIEDLKNENNGSNVDILQASIKSDSKQVHSGIPIFLDKDCYDKQIPNEGFNNDSLVSAHSDNLENISETIENIPETNKNDRDIHLPLEKDIMLKDSGLPVSLEDGTDDEKIATKISNNNQSWDSYQWSCKHCQVELDSIEQLRLHGLQLHKKCYSFKCFECDLDLFNMFNPFIEHMRQHFDELRYYCPHCYVRFDCTSECTAHLLSHWSDGQRICEWCGEICKDGDELKLHKSLSRKIRLHRKVYRKKPRLVTACRQYKGIPELALGTWDDYEWTCQDCSLRLPSVQCLREHTQLLHDKCFSMKCVDCLIVPTCYSTFTKHVSGHRPYLKNYCIYCNRHIEDQKDLEKHIKDHRTSEQRPCDACGQIFQNNELEKQHLDRFQPARRKMYMTTNDLTCNICEKVCTNITKLKSHKEVHSESRKKDQVCPTCGAQFFNNYNLEFHIAAKHGDKDKIHKCKVCNKKFSIELYLRQHINRVHTAKQKFICDHCSKEYNSKRSLTNHIIRLTKKNKKKKCNICSKLYYNASGLKIHMNTHTGARPYQCQNCDKTFTNWANCNKHMLRIHGTTLCKTKQTKHGRVPIGVGVNITPDVQDWIETLTKKKVIKRKKNSKKAI